MSPLTSKHAQLLKSNRALMISLEGFPLPAKLSVVALALAIGVYGSINALKGTASDMVQVCIRSKQSLQCADKTGKPYIMTQYHAEQWKADGVPGEVVFKNTIPATNPHKALWMALAAGSFSAAGVVLRSLQNSERQLATYEAIAEKRDSTKAQISARAELIEDYRNVAIAEVHLQADLESAANDRAVVLKQCEVLGEADIKIAQLEAEEALFEAETAGLSDEKKQEYLEFLRNQRTPFQLTGTQTLDSISYPGDKVEPQSWNILESNPNVEISRQIATKILNSLAGINTSIFLAAPTRCGKTHTLHKWLRDLITRFPQADIYVISQKYEDFPGVVRDRLTVFDPLLPEQSMQFLDEVYEKLQQRKLEPATEEVYRNRPIKLILEDWFATHQCLSQKRNAAIWEVVAAKLGMIATVGGQYNVGYFICTQSFNVASSGVADSNIRLNLALIAQGLVRTTSNDEEQGSYGVIEQMLNNPRVIASKETRDRLTANLSLLIPTSMAQQTPLILSTIGNPVLGLMPKIEVNNAPIAPSPAPDSTVTAESDSAYLNRLYNLEFDLSKPEPPTETSETPPETVKRRQSNDSDEPGVYFTNLKLDYSRARELVLKLRNEMKHNQSEIIWMLWNAKPGNTKAYEMALAEFKELVKPSN